MWGGEMCAIWKDPRYFSSWCPPSHLQSRTCAGSRLQNGKTGALGTSVQHYLSTAETTTQGYSVVQNPNHLQKYELCLLLAAGSCMKTILLESDLSRVSNMNSSFCFFFYLAVLKNDQGSFLLHPQFLRAGSDLELHFWKAEIEDCILPIHME